MRGQSGYADLTGLLLKTSLPSEASPGRWRRRMKAQSGIEGDQIDTMDEGFLLSWLIKIHFQQFLACIRHGMGVEVR